MLFNSLQFVFFFPAVVALYFATPHRFRWVLLLAASYYFYAAWRPEYLVLIFASTVVDYLAGRGMGRFEGARIRKALLFASVATNLGILFGFKYLSFFNESVRAVLNQFNIFYGTPALDILLPVGISFYTFQSLSYTIDVYRGVTPPQRHFGIFALYVSFFPQLVAGPIERSYRLMPQFFEHRGFHPDAFASGLRLMLWGFFMKVVIADRLALYVDPVYGDPGLYGGTTLLVATYLFAFQIFCDFAGYSAIAIGAARVLGYELMENFRRPYFAASIREFWGRWHISLSTWFRDYVYIPLGGNRVGTTSRWYANIFIVFLVSGLWHGAAWTFVIWGALHGTYLIVSLVTQGMRDRVWEGIAVRTSYPFRRVGPLAEAIPGSDGGRGSRLQTFPAIAGLRRWIVGERTHGTPSVGSSGGPELPTWIRFARRALAVVVTFHLVLVAWVFFRAGSLADALVVLQAVGQGGGTLVGPLSVWQFRLAISSIIVLLGVQALRELWPRSESPPTAIRWCMDYALIFAILIFGEFGAQEFIYFQF
jgi:alginate O-acetyltransferase complex protein AlgI